MSNINLTAQLLDRDLTSPERGVISDTISLIIYDGDIRIARNGDTRITRNGDTRLAHNTGSGYPFLLTGLVSDRDLISPERI